MILTTLLFACKEDIAKLESTQACQDNSMAENIFNDLGDIIEQGLQVNGQSKSCPNYNLINSDTLDIDTLIIDFGNINCLYKGKLRRGVINITYTGKRLHPSSIITSTFDNYYVNNHLVEGERIITNEGINNNGNMWFTIEVDASITTSQNGTINWKSNRVREWTHGQNTFDISDDKYKITGNVSGNGINGNPFTMTIIDTLNIDISCFPSCIIKSGATRISPDGYSDRIINYGDSLCDCNIVVTINETTYPLVIEN